MFARILKYGLPILAAGLFLLAVVHVMRSNWKAPAQDAQPIGAPPTSPFSRSVAAAGIVEAQTENISIGSPVPGIVTNVFVRVGENVALRDPLFRLDDRKLQAELRIRQAALKAAEAEWERLRNQPRPEQIPVAQARVRAAEADAIEKRNNWARSQRLFARNVITQEALESSRQALAISEANLAQARAELDLLLAGTWKFDEEVAQAAVARAAAEVEETRSELDRLLVRALVAGEVLQVNVRPGEFVGAPPSQALIVLGNTQTLHVRVDIDEYDIPRFQLGAPAVAMLRGHPERRYALAFERVEPYVIPKRSLTGESTERIDTRVLQVIYRIIGPGARLYVGQQVDVYIDATRQTEPPPPSHQQYPNRDHTSPPPTTAQQSARPR